MSRYRPKNWKKHPIDPAHPRISLILPVYNVERFLPACLDSLAAQTFRDFEAIAVDDGSTDRCGEILQEYAGRLPFLRVIHQENAGMSAARNTGMLAARGEYLGFVDSDDTLSPYFLEELYRAAYETGADISCCYYYYHFIETDVLYKYPFRCEGVFDHGGAMEKLLRDTQIQNLVWNKLYRRRLFTDFDITFPTMAFEDIATMSRVFAHANRVVVLNKALYYYTQRGTSTLGSINASKINDFIRATVTVRMNLESAGAFEQYRGPFRALCRKTGFCCAYYVLKMHLRKRTPRGCAQNLRSVWEAAWYYAGDEFTPMRQLYGELPDVVSTPQKLKELKYR